MLKKVADQVYQLKVPIPYDFGEVNCYLIKGKNGYTIVDTGDDTEEAKALWTKVLSDNIPVEKVVLTHVHSDHIGLSGWFQKNFNAPVWMSSKTYDEMFKIRSLFKDKIFLDSTTTFNSLHGGPNIPSLSAEYHRFENYQFEPDMVFEDNQEIKLGDSTYQTLWTPGHSPDHFCFYNKEKEILFIGDHVLESVNPIVVPQQVGENPLKGYLKSLDRLTECPTKYVLPGHDKIIKNLPKRIKNMRTHYKKRWKQTYNSIRAKGSTAYQVSQVVYGEELPLHRAMSAFMQTVTNLVYLESEGHVRMKKHDGKMFYYQDVIVK